MYLSSKSTTLTAALCPTSTLRRVMSVGEAISHTAMERSLEQVTIMPLLNRKCRTASQWWINVFSISPVFTSHTLEQTTLRRLSEILMVLMLQCTTNIWPLCFPPLLPHFHTSTTPYSSAFLKLTRGKEYWWITGKWLIEGWDRRVGKARRQDAANVKCLKTHYFKYGHV